MFLVVEQKKLYKFFDVPPFFPRIPYLQKPGMARSLFGLARKLAPKTCKTTMQLRGEGGHTLSEQQEPLKNEDHAARRSLAKNTSCHLKSSITH